MPAEAGAPLLLSCYNFHMSKLAGILLFLFGAATIVIGIREIRHLDQLTPYAAWTSVGLGLLMAIAGVGHFRAPHKSFILSIPVLLAFQLQVYCFALFYDVKNLPIFLTSFLVSSALILLLSYLGYRRMSAA
jgi:amino acid transporter